MSSGSLFVETWSRISFDRLPMPSSVDSCTFHLPTWQTHPLLSGYQITADMLLSASLPQTTMTNYGLTGDLQMEPSPDKLSWSGH